jgi:hypothetical protein
MPNPWGDTDAALNDVALRLHALQLSVQASTPGTDPRLVLDTAAQFVKYVAPTSIMPSAERVALEEIAEHVAGPHMMLGGDRLATIRRVVDAGLGRNP